MTHSLYAISPDSKCRLVGDAKDVAQHMTSLTPDALVAVLSFSRLARDSRVMRQCELLRHLGHEPLVIAFAEPDDAAGYTLVHRPTPQPTTARRLATLARRLPAHLGRAAASAGFWAEAEHRWALAELRRHRPALVIANDWPALVVAAEYKRAHGGKVHYDTHEFATLEFDERWWWRTVYKPMVRHLESGSLDAADGISTVGDRLADALAASYGLQRRPVVVRNIPDGIALPDAAPAQWPLRILYHGRVLPDRGLETLLLSVKRWETPHQVTIRGDGDEGYVDRLKSIVAAEGIGAQVTFAAAVPPRRVMPIAVETADLGVHFTPLGTDQRHFSLPNKVFEYIGAGLAIAVSPGADLKTLVEAHGVGVVAEDDTAHGAATAINSLTQQSVDAFKTSARRAARMLCWENERQRLADALTPLLPVRHTSRPH